MLRTSRTRSFSASHIPLTLLLTAWLVFSACGKNPASATGSDEAAPPVAIPVVVALGDSLTAGPGLAPDETYPARLQARVAAAGYPHIVMNAGVSGDTSSGALRRVDRALTPDARVLIIAVGANDGLQGVPVERVRDNIAEIIERAQARNIRVLLCGMETPPTRGWEYTQDFHAVFPELAARYSVALMPFLLTGVVGDPAFNLGDRIHPNATGAQRIAANMWPYLEPLLKD